MESVDAAALQGGEEVTSTTGEAPPPASLTNESPTVTEGMENLQLHSTEALSTIPPPEIPCTNPFSGELGAAAEVPVGRQGDEEDERWQSRKPSTDNSVASWIDAVQAGVGAVDAKKGGVVALAALAAAGLDTDASDLSCVGREEKGEDGEGHKGQDDQSRRRGASKPAKATRATGCKRGRTTSAKVTGPREDAAALHAFKHSQRSLRKEAKGLSMKEVLARSQVLSPTTESSQIAEEGGPTGSGSPVFSVSTGGSVFFSPPLAPSATDSNPFFSPTHANNSSLLSPASPTSGSAAAPPSPWSPALVTDITRSFLANVERQKKQTVERLLPRDFACGFHGKVHSPPSHRRGCGGRDGDGAAALKRRRLVAPLLSSHPTPTTPPPHSSANATAGAFPSDPAATASLCNAVMEDLLGVDRENEEDEGESQYHRSDPFAAPPAEDGADGTEDEEDELLIREGVDGEGEGDTRSLNATYVSEHSMRLQQMTGQQLGTAGRDGANASATLLSFANEHSLSVGGSQSQSAHNAGTSGLLRASPLPMDEASSQQQQESQRRREEAAEAAHTRAATRRHEIWKLRQRNLKAQRLLHGPTATPTSGSGLPAQTTSTAHPRTHGTDGGALVHSLDDSKSVFEGMMRRFVTAPVGTPASTPVHSSGSSSGLRDPVFHRAEAPPLRPFDVSDPSSPTSLSTRKGLSTSIRDVNLSQSDVSMIVRLNSFDRTSSQKVVVFGTAAAAAKEAEGKRGRAAK